MRVKWIEHKTQSKPATADSLVSRRARYKRVKRGNINENQRLTMCRTKNKIECNNIVASLDASWLSLTETRPGSCERAGSPELPGRGDACICSVAKAVAR